MAEPAKAKDLVCGMDVDEQEAHRQGLEVTFQGIAYYFCSPGCKRQFERNPEQYVNRQQAAR